MAELDDRLLRDLARLRARSSPPPGAEQRVRAALEATLGPGPGGGDDGGSAFGDGGSTVGGLGGAGGGGGGKVALGAKLLAAAAAATGAGALLINLGVGSPQQQVSEAPTTPIEVSTTKIANDEPRSSAKPQLEPEPPILVTPLAAPPVRVQRPSEREQDPLTAEVTLLEQARATDDPTARLELLEQHRERFQTGLLAAERESLRISTLCELDRLGAARQAAQAFLLAHPRSPLRLRMRSACPELDILAELD